MTNTTRDVVVDLWPLYVSGEASADTQALVEAFIAQDPEFGKRLREKESAGLKPPALTLPQDHERATLLRTQRRRARQSMLVNGLALLTSTGMTAYYAWGVVPLWSAVFASAGLPLPPGMRMATNASTWILRISVPLGLLALPFLYAFRKRLRVPAFLESGTVLAVATGIALVLAQLCWLALLNEASTSLADAHRALRSR
jgi:hypothetical protein